MPASKKAKGGDCLHASNTVVLDVSRIRLQVLKNTANVMAGNTEALAILSWLVGL